MGIPLGLGQGVQLLQPCGLTGTPVQPIGQPLPAVREGVEVRASQFPQPGEHTSFIVPQGRGVVHGQFSLINQRSQVGGRRIVRMVPPIVSRPYPGNGKHSRGKFQPPGGPQVLNAQVIIGVGQAGCPSLSQQIPGRQMPAPGEGQPLIQIPAQSRLELRAVQGIRRTGQQRPIP